MTTAHESATLNRKQYQRALELLDEERDALSLGRWQRVAYIFLSVAVFGWLLFFIAWFVTMMVAVSDSSLGLDAPLLEISAVLLVISTLFGLVSPLAFLLNFPLVWKIVVQARLVRKLGLKELFASEMRHGSRWAPVLRALSMFLSACGLLLIGGGIISLFSEPPTAEDARLWTWFSLFLIATGFSVFSFYFIRRGRRKLKVAAEISRLSKTFHAFELGDRDEISIPGQYLNELENVERQQIARDRGQTVLMSAAESAEPQYFMQKSRAAREAVDALPMDRQLLLDGAFAGLASDPHPSGAEATEAGQYVWYPEGSEVRVRYALDEAEKKIQLLAVESRSAHPEGNVEG